MPTRQHGTRACYVFGPGPGRGKGCRCFQCRVASTRYETQLQAKRRPPYRVRWIAPLRVWRVSEYVPGRDLRVVHETTDREEAYRVRDELNRRHRPPDPIWLSPDEEAELRQHLDRLQSHGLTGKAICRAARINPKTLERIRLGHDPAPGRDRGEGYGPRTHRGRTRIRRSTGARILAVTVSDAGNCDAVDAGPSMELVDVLLRAGYTKRWIAARLGAKPGAALQIGRSGKVAGRTERAVRDLYERLWRADPRVRLAAEGGSFPRRIRDRWGKNERRGLQGDDVAGVDRVLERRRRQREYTRRRREGRAAS